MKEEEDLYAKFKALQRQEEFLDLQEEYIKDEMRNLKRELIRAKEVRCHISLFHQATISYQIRLR